MLDGPAVETPPESKPKKPKMVNVYNSHRFKSFYMGHGRKIGPHQSGRIPLAVFNKVKDTITWLQRAERGDVLK